MFFFHVLNQEDLSSLHMTKKFTKVLVAQWAFHAIKHKIVQKIVIFRHMFDQMIIARENSIANGASKPLHNKNAFLNRNFIFFSIIDFFC